MKNDRAMPVNVQAQKWHLAHFGPKDGSLDIFFKISTSNLFYIKIDSKTK